MGAENATWKLVCALPYNCHFQPWIRLEGPEGATISLNSSNPLVLYLTPTETYTTTAGEQTYEAKNWVSGEGAIYTIPAGVTVKAVKYRETGYATTFAGSFECNDNDYNILWKKAARTACICMREGFYDCPDRERVGFWGDGTPELDQCFYVFDTASHRLAKQLVLRKLEPEFYPGQHLEFLGDYGLWFYYLQTGDLESIRTVYDATKKFLFEVYKHGNRGTWFDWGKEVKDTAVIETCFYYNCLGTLKKMALATGHDAKIPIDVAAANAIDGDHWTGWRDMTKPQYEGQWFQVDMMREETFDTIELDTTWALWDSPVAYSVAVSKDGSAWQSAVATGAGRLGITTITFPTQRARSIRITQTGTSPTYHWSIYELDVYTTTSD